jgi:hypothetical protein
MLGVPRTTLAECIESAHEINVSPEEERLVCTYNKPDSYFVSRTSLWLFSAAERLQHEKDRKMKRYRLIVAFSERGELPAVIKAELAISPCGYMMRQALAYRKSHS